ncbi:acyl-CoA dehydrogenase [Novosphingobium bradum]|uniref:Acyl-CoA dehydrogenase n=1 Tax=Novosphingobium bradum TaxID=1737444 RepID=A0ABV7IM99_9SPHN
MNFEPTDDQKMIVETFARFLDEHSTTARVRAAMPTGFDRELWRGFADLGGLAMRVPESAGGLGLGLFDAVLVMQELGRTLGSGPFAEAIAASRVLAAAGEGELLGQVMAGEAVVVLALHDAAERPSQIVAGGAVADGVIVREGGKAWLVTPTEAERQGEPNLAGTPLAEIALTGANRRLLAAGTADEVLRAVEEWKLLIAAALGGLSAQALRLAGAYASERVQFGQLIGTYQGVSHPLADFYADNESGRYFIWKIIYDIANGVPDAAAEISLALWWMAKTATGAVARALHTFGGYGLTTEYDVHLFNLRAKAWPLVLGDPADLLHEGAARRYGGQAALLPDAGAVSIDFDLGEDAYALADEVRAAFAQILTPELRAKAHYSFDGHDRGVDKALAERGLLYPGWPKEMGGRGASPYAAGAAARVWEEIGWSAHAQSTSKMVGQIINLFGSDALKADALQKIIRGEAICSLGYSEPHAGSDAFAAKTRAVREGDGWRITGQKMFTSGANIADYVMLLTRTDPDLPKHKGLTMFLVPLNSEGITIQPVYTFQDERTNITYYDNVFVPDSHRLGEVNGGGKVTAAGLSFEHGGAGFLAPLLRLLAETEEFCRTTTRRGRPLIEDPLVQARLARVFCHGELVSMIGNLLSWASVEKKGGLVGSIGKLFSSEMFQADAADLIDLAAPESLFKRKGPIAYINQSYRHAQGTTIYGGTSEIHRSQVAERGLGLPRSRS